MTSCRRKPGPSQRTHTDPDIAACIHSAQLAPSAHNTHPWLFKAVDNRVNFYADLAKRLPVADPDNRELYISIGCALTNFLVAAQHYGFETAISYPLCDNLIATVTLTKTDRNTAQKDSLFDAITKRHTDRSLYTHKPIPEPIIQQLHNCCMGDVQLIVVAGALKEQIAQLIYDGDRVQFANQAYTDELAYWIKHGLIYSGFMRSCVSFAVNHLPIGRFVAAHDKKLIVSAPLFGILCAPNTPRAWVQVGETYEKIALIATAHGISTHPMNQGLTEVPAQQHQLKKLINTSVEPLFTCRIGYPLHAKK